MRSFYLLLERELLLCLVDKNVLIMKGNKVTAKEATELTDGKGLWK
jgi:hypothetical protein